MSTPTQNTGSGKELQEKTLLLRCSLEIPSFSTKLERYTSTLICNGMKNSSEYFLKKVSPMLDPWP